MQPQNNPQTNFNLPPVAPEQLPSAGASEGSFRAPEVAPAAPESAPNSAAAAPTFSIPQMPQNVPQAMAPTAAPIVAPTTASAASITTEDGDLIEKEWVNKAKQIVEQTHNDPHQQSKALSGLKADYLQKRYHKEIRQSE